MRCQLSNDKLNLEAEVINLRRHVLRMCEIVEELICRIEKIEMVVLSKLSKTIEVAINEQTR